MGTLARNGLMCSVFLFSFSLQVITYIILIKQPQLLFLDIFANSSASGCCLASA